MVHMPFAISVSNGMGKERVLINDISVTTFSTDKKYSAVAMLYDSLHLSSAGLSEDAFNYAVKGYELLREQGKLKNQKVLTIIDFTKPSYQKRLFILDVENYKLLFHTYVAHGRNTGAEYANKFSNTPESFQSSLGFYITTGTYTGKNGFSLQLAGIEKGINHLAEERAIVMHGAPYVSEGFIKSRGYIGRSHGCPALPEKLNKPIIEKIKNGSCLFIYSNDKSYLDRSKILNS
jgi:L,D-transpeptidase catalytic domain